MTKFKQNLVHAIVLMACTILSPSLQAKGDKDKCIPYKDSTLSVEVRVMDLLSRMTLEEKMWQLNMNNLNLIKLDSKGRPIESSLEELFNGGYGLGILESPFIEHEKIAALSEAADKYLRTKTRLGIPAIQMAECIHGQMALNTTIFPQVIGQGSTWNPALIKEMGEVIASEATVSGVDFAFSPLFDLARDARYGRVEECFGEDPYHVKEMGVAFVLGMQGEVEQSKIKLEPGKIGCTGKHFVAYSVPDAGINLGPANVGERTLRELHLYPFEGAVKEANIYSIMPGYHEVDGVPVHADPWLLKELLREEWGFDGVVISDAVAISMLEFFHKVAATNDDAAVMALTSGVDVEVSTPVTYKRLDALVKEGRIKESTLDSSVANVLRMKFKMGLFDRPYVNPYKNKKKKPKVHTPENIDLALRMAQESVVLLQNNNNILPLNPDKLNSLAVIGPNANNVQFGDYSVTKHNDYGITVYEGLQDYLGDKVKLNFAEGCGIMSPSKDGFQEAIDAAKKSDAIVLVLGGTSVIYSGIGWGDQNSTQPNTCGEGFDRNELNFPGIQPELLDTLSTLGKPIILVMVNGRPYTIEEETKKVEAILEAWYPGEMGGKAVAQILFGEVNPSGKLPVSFVRTAGHIPNASIYKQSSRGFYKRPGSPEKSGRDYVFSSPTPLFSFGHGLSYTTFEYSDLTLTPTADGVEVTVKLTNTGERDGAEVVQVYVQDVISSVTTPVRALKAFDKIFLKSKESKVVKLLVKQEDLKLWNYAMKRVFEPGDFEFYVGSSQEDIRVKQLIKL